MAHTLVLIDSNRPVGVIVRHAFERAGIPWSECRREDSGDRLLVLVPARYAVADLPSALARAAHAADVRLRAVIDVQPGELTSSAVATAFQLLADPRVAELVAGPVQVGIVAVGGALAEVPAGTVVHSLAGARVYLLTRPPDPADLESGTGAFRLISFPGDPATAATGATAATLTGDGRSALLAAADQVVRFFGRTEELARLASWLTASPAVSVLLIHGPGGQGKTRLAAEFADRAAASGWRTSQAVLEPSQRDDAGPDLGGDHILVVVDYAERWPRRHLTDLLRHVRARRPGRVRLLLVARQAGYWWKALANPLAKAGAAVSELPLGALADTVTQRRAAFAAARDRFAELLGVTDVGRLRAVGLLEDDAYGLALTLFMAALVVVDAHARGADAPTDPGGLSAYLIRREQDHWQTMVDNGRIGARPEVMARLVAVATLTRSLPVADAQRVIVEVGLAATAADAQNLIDDHSACYPPPGTRVLSPLLPDRLGEDLIADLLTDDAGRGDPWAGRLPGSLVTGTAPHEPAVLSVLIETAARWEHVYRGHLVPLLLRRPGLVLRAEGAALVTLAGYADPDLLEALTANLPDRHVELDGGIAALTTRLTNFALTRTEDETARARLYESMAARLSNAGLYEDAVAAGAEVIAIRRRLRQHAPSRHEPALADSLGNLGIDLWHVGRLADSTAAMQEAVDLYRGLASGDPGVYNDDLAAELANLAGALIGMERFEEALAPAEEATTLFRRLSRDRAGLDLELASAQRNYAIVLGNLGRDSESLDAIASAAAIFGRLADDKPHAHAADLAETLHTWSNRLAAAGRDDEAVRKGAESVAILRRLAAANPAAHELSLVLASTSLAGRLWRTGRQDEAISTDHEAVDIARRWATPSPALAAALGNLARHLHELGEHAAALAVIDDAVDVWRAVTTDSGTFADRLARAEAIRARIVGAMEPPGRPD